MLELRSGERYHFSLEGGLGVDARVTAVNERVVVLVPLDLESWSGELRLKRRSVYGAERLWQARPRPVDPSAVDWFAEMPWLIWKEGTQPELRDRWRRKAKCKPLFPDAVEPKKPRRKLSPEKEEQVGDGVTRTDQVAGDRRRDRAARRQQRSRGGRTGDQLEDDLQPT